MSVIFIHSDWKRVSGRGNIKTYFCIQIELDKWQSFSWKSSWRGICRQVALSRDKVPTEGEMRVCLKGQTEEGLHIHRQQRGHKNQEQQDFRKNTTDFVKISYVLQKQYRLALSKEQLFWYIQELHLFRKMIENKTKQGSPTEKC